MSATVLTNAMASTKSFFLTTSSSLPSTSSHAMRPRLGPEAPLAGGPLVLDADVDHPRPRRTLPAPCHQPGDGVLVTFEGGLDPAVGPVPHPPRHARSLGLSSAAGAEADALHLAGYHDPF